MNIKLAHTLIQKLRALGVREYLVCAGARNAPLVKVLNQIAQEDVLHFFDERAAGFFALGRAKREERPVAVVTTSGTAVAELLPSAVEAYYSGVPIVFITADRPQSYRQTGAPQSIEQVGIFSTYAVVQYDFTDEQKMDDLELSADAPTHINICFSEPLIDEDVQILKSEPFAEKSFNGKKRVSHNLADKIKIFFSQYSRPLIVLSGIKPQFRSSVFEFLNNTYVPIYAEATSGLREVAQLQERMIKGGERVLQKLDFTKHFDSLLRIGSVPTFRLWRDLENQLTDIPVLSVSDLPFSGLSRKGAYICAYEDFLNFAQRQIFQPCINTSLPFTETEQKLLQILNKNINSEPAMFRWLSESIPQGSHIMLGNSLPIREWDLAATYQNKSFQVTANRGANGIDGLISTFLGQASATNENWLILGDLSTLYDLNALAFSSFQSTQAKLRIVVVNNGGGQIFSSMFKDKNFLNEHNLKFNKWAEMFGWEYQTLNQTSELKLSSQPTVIEIVPDATTTQNFWLEYERIFK